METAPATLRKRKVTKASSSCSSSRDNLLHNPQSELDTNINREKQGQLDRHGFTSLSSARSLTNRFLAGPATFSAGTRKMKSNVTEISDGGDRDCCEKDLKKIDENSDGVKTPSSVRLTPSPTYCPSHTPTQKPTMSESECCANSVNCVDGVNSKQTKLEEKEGKNQDEDVSKKYTEKSKESEAAKGTRAYYVCLMLFSLFGLYTRLYNVEVPDHICWDETHFGKMGSWYINRTFFFDVHPPLGKMMIGLAGYLTGYDGSFHFSKPGDMYGDTNYVGMRVFCALLGSALVPFVYQIVFLLTQSLLASIFAASFVLFDTGTNTLSRYILLDPPLLFFIMASAYFNLKFISHRDRPFSVCWWFWMLATGISLSGAIGVKFVGLFVVILVGLWTAWDLNRLLSEISLHLSEVAKHLLARALCLIIVPVIGYVVYFYIHFKVLNHSGSGDGFFSSAFQSQLIGNKLYNVSMPQHVAFGSVISLKQRRTGGAYLHSHAHLYPEEVGPRQQQVTTYSHKDENNMWKIKPADRDVNTDEPVVLVKNGDLIRLEHIVTRRNLHSHKEPAPLSKRHYQVSGYGVNGSGDANDVWLVEIVGAPPEAPVQTVRSQIRLVHYYVRCFLFSHDRKLPKWGWEQLEATCNTNTRDQRSHWNVEEVRDARLPNVSFELYSPSFLEKITESHAVMTQGNSGLKPKEGEITSRPWQWPIDYRGQIFSGKDHRVYLLGNPFLFWTALVLKVIFLICYTVFRIKQKRKVRIVPAVEEYNRKMFTAMWWLLLGWGLHYFPFWTMSRVLYFHHYFPAYLFSAMFCGVMLDYLVTHVCLFVPEGLSTAAFFWCITSIMGSILFSFYLFYPLTYGIHGNNPSAEGGMMHGLRWLDSWDI